jgi:hypothetical protein
MTIEHVAIIRVQTMNSSLGECCSLTVWEVYFDSGDHTMHEATSVKCQTVLNELECRSVRVLGGGKKEVKETWRGGWETGGISVELR